MRGATYLFHWFLSSFIYLLFNFIKNPFTEKAFSIIVTSRLDTYITYANSPFSILLNFYLASRPFLGKFNTKSVNGWCSIVSIMGLRFHFPISWIVWWNDEMGAVPTLTRNVSRKCLFKWTPVWCEKWIDTFHWKCLLIIYANTQLKGKYHQVKSLI